MKNILLAVVFVFLANFAFATTSGDVAGDAEAKIVATLTLTHTENAKLNFGTLVSPTTAGTVTISKNADTATYSNVEGVSGNAVTRDHFDVTNPEGVSFSVTLPPSAATLQGSVSGSMTVDNFDADCTSNCTGAGFYVGGRLNVGANQPAGTYTGTYNVSITY